MAKTVNSKKQNAAAKASAKANAKASAKANDQSQTTAAKTIILGIDVGGTSIKGVALKEGKEIFWCDEPTGKDDLAAQLESIAEKLASGAGAVFSEIIGVGVCCPGTIDGAKGVVAYAANLRLKNYPLKQKLEKLLGLPVKVCNDANGAALGEAVFGASSGYKDSVFVTLGTGVGGGIIIDGKIFEGNKGAGTEIGHMVIERGGDRCSCGRYGCFEAYCSARALTRRTRWAMEDDTGSAMWKNYDLSTADGRTAFEHMDGDRTARRVVEWYIKYLACGLANLANIFRPQAIILGGGVSAQGSRLIKPLKEQFEKELFGGSDYAPVEIKCAKLGAKSGAYGAVALFM